MGECRSSSPSAGLDYISTNKSSHKQNGRDCLFRKSNGGVVCAGGRCELKRPVCFPYKRAVWTARFVNCAGSPRTRTDTGRLVDCVNCVNLLGEINGRRREREREKENVVLSSWCLLLKVSGK